MENPASETKQRAEERKKCGLEDSYNDDEGLNDVKECMDGEPMLLALIARSNFRRIFSSASKLGS